MATLHDTASALNNASEVGPLATGDSLAVSIGDVICVGCRWEDANGATCTVADGTHTYSVGRALIDHSASSLHQQVFYAISTIDGTVTPAMTLSAARSWRRMRAISFTPAGGTTFEIDGSGAADQGTGTSSVSSGSASATAAGASVCFVSSYFGATYTAGSGWTEPAEFDDSGASIVSTGEYQLQSGAGSLTGDMTLSANNDWISQMVIFKEVSGGSSIAPGSRISLLGVG